MEFEGEGEGVFPQLPDDLLLIFVRKFPTKCLVRIRVVCKEWNNLLSSTNASEIIFRNVPVVHTPAFFLQLRWTKHASFTVAYPLNDLQSWIIESATGELHKVPMPNFDNRTGNCVIDVCKSIYSCFQGETGHTKTLRICNPGTNTWVRLPYNSDMDGWGFCGLAFDPSTRQCTLLFGRSSNPDGGITIDSYDSQSNSWTKIDFVFSPGTGLPRGRGVYSRGRFYWLHGSGYTIQFNMLERMCTKIRHPNWVYFTDFRDLEDLEKHYHVNVKRMNYSIQTWDGRLCLKFHSNDGILFRANSWSLSGTDGRVVLVNKRIGCIWELQEESNEWRQLHIMIGKPIHGVVVNSIGWTLAAGEKKLFVYDDEGRLRRNIDYSEIDPQATPMPETCDLSEYMWAFEWNNVWWP